LGINCENCYHEEVFFCNCFSMNKCRDSLTYFQSKVEGKTNSKRSSMIETQLETFCRDLITFLQPWRSAYNYSIMNSKWNFNFPIWNRYKLCVQYNKFLNSKIIKLTSNKKSISNNSSMTVSFKAMHFDKVFQVKLGRFLPIV
jgi:hypothetical protein